MFYLTTHSTHFIYSYMASDIWLRTIHCSNVALLATYITSDPLGYFSFQPVLHDWCNKGRGMCYPVCGMVHIKEPLLLIGKNSPCGGSRFLSI